MVNGGFMCQKYRFQFREERALCEKRMICKISGSKSDKLEKRKKKNHVTPDATMTTRQVSLNCYLYMVNVESMKGISIDSISRHFANDNRRHLSR